MKKFTYQILEASSGDELAAKVTEKINSEIKMGWQLAGGVSVCISQALGRKTVYAQAITKLEQQGAN